MSHSRVSCFNGCPRQYQLKYVECLERIDKQEFQNDSVWGSAIHAGLQAHYLGGQWSDVEKAFVSAYPADLNPSDEAKSQEGGILCLKNYIEFYREQDKDWKILKVEVKGKVLNGEDSHNVIIDIVAMHIPSQTVYAWDHKTTTTEKMKYSFWKRYELDAQVTMYTEHIRQEYGSCAGFWINGIAVGHRKRMYKGEPAGHYQKFERNLFPRTNEQIDDWKRSDTKWKRMMEFAQKDDVFPKAFNGLCNYCEFSDLCKSADDPQILELLYQRKIEVKA